MKLWLQDRLVNESESGFVDSWPTGSGVFETLLTKENHIYEFNRHMRRALSSCQQLGIRFPSEDFIRNAAIELLKSQKFPLGRMRVHFANDFFAITNYPFSPQEAPAILISKGLTRVDSAHKKYPYSDRLELIRQARELKADDFLLWNVENNQVAESGVSNILLLINGQWCTPPLSSGILPGVVRAIAIEYCDVKVRVISKNEIIEATAGLLTSSLKIAQVIDSIDGRKLVDQQATLVLATKIRENYQWTSVG